MVVGDGTANCVSPRGFTASYSDVSGTYRTHSRAVGQLARPGSARTLSRIPPKRDDSTQAALYHYATMFQAVSSRCTRICIPGTPNGITLLAFIMADLSAALDSTLFATRPRSLSWTTISCNPAERPLHQPLSSVSYRAFQYHFLPRARCRMPRRRETPLFHAGTAFPRVRKRELWRGHSLPLCCLCVWTASPVSPT